MLFSKSESTPDSRNGKDITTEFSLNLSVPGLDDTITYKKYDGNEEYKNRISKLAGSLDIVDSREFDVTAPILDSLEYIIVKCGKSDDCVITVYPEKKQTIKYKNKSLSFTVPNIAHQQKNYINLKIYLEKYKYI